nr:unnamed protein product [Digitaria exilis]
MATATLAAPPFLPSSPPAPARARRSRTTRPFPRVACAYALQEGQSRRFHRLPCGLDLEVIAQPPPAPGERPPLVFVHGSFHAAWCWAEHWLPFFSRAGFPCYALSLRAQGESSVPQEAVAGTLETHTGDIADFIQKEIPSPPVLIGHSFGGLIVQQYISCLQDSEYMHQKFVMINLRFIQSISDRTFLILGSEFLHPKLAGAVLVCSVPPSGNSGLVWRYLLTKPVAAIKVNGSALLVYYTFI